eukprot:1161047-Pelagomonas_calceolata.AAC.3
MGGAEGMQCMGCRLRRCAGHAMLEIEACAWHPIARLSVEEVHGTGVPENLGDEAMRALQV